MSALKKPTCHEAPKKAPTDSKSGTQQKPKLVDVNADNATAKAEIDRMRKLLAEKIKDPDLARKAAMIISEMLDKK